MFVLLNNGYHPLFDKKKDDCDSYFEKLEDPKWVFPSNFSKFAKDLFLKLAHPESSERYATH